MNINNTYRLPHLFKLYSRRVKEGVCILFLFAFLSSCVDELEQTGITGQGETATLELSLSVPPMLETKAMVCEADSGSEARKAGFYYEMQILTTDTMSTDSLTIATKAAASLKNVYAFLFKSDGSFNGRASLSTAGVGSNLSLVFTNIADASATNGRLVIIANDNAATVNYTSSTAFANFSGTYAAFQNLTLTSAVTADVNIPYVGSATVSLSGGSFSAVPTVQLYRMLAKIVLTNNTFSITSGPSRNAISLFNAGNKYFGTPNDNGNSYNGAGSTVTASGRYLTTATTGSNANSNTWYVGENIQTAATNAAYIQLGTNTNSVVNTSPAIGQEYVSSGGYSFTYKVYLKNYALRRNNVYNVTVNVSGTLAKHLELASTNSNVSVTSTVEHGGLNIGKFGGASYTGTGTAPTITGSYTKNLLIQSNTSKTTAADNITAVWGSKGTVYQTYSRKYWDYIYIKGITTDGLVGGMSKAAGSIYYYCYELTIGGVSKGTWYPPTYTQLQAIWTVLGRVKEFEYYAGITSSVYIGSTEDDSNDARGVNFSNGGVGYGGRDGQNKIRCVRDL